MAVIKVFDSTGVKTVKILENVMMQDYDPVPDSEDDEINEAAEQTDDGF